jgi:hypothetical protein
VRLEVVLELLCVLRVYLINNYAIYCHRLIYIPEAAILSLACASIFLVLLPRVARRVVVLVEVGTCERPLGALSRILLKISSLLDAMVASTCLGECLAFRDGTR